MLPDALLSTYEQYKHDTAIVSSWLVQTARKYGYSRPLEAVDNELKSKSSRLKGKARKQMAKAADARATATSHGKQRQDYMLAIKNFVPLAEFIAAVKQPKPVVDYVLEPEDTIEDAYFAFCALIQDARSPRFRISGLWTGYKEGAIQLAPICLAATTAIRLLRQIEEDIAPLIRNHGGFPRWIHAYYEATCQGQGKNAETRERPRDGINMDTDDIADFCMFNTWQFLDAFRRAHSPGQYQAYNGQFGNFDPNLERSKLSNRTKYQQDKAVLLEILGDISILTSALKANKCQDEFAQGVQLMLKAGQVPLWLAFSAQLFLDTLRCLHGSHAVRPFEEMLAWNSIIAESITKTMTYHRNKKLRIENWPPSHDENLQDIIHLCKLWANDPIGALKERHGIPSKPFFFLHRHAMFCGMWINHVRGLFHEAGTLLTMAWGSTLYTGHLYHAMRREKLLGDATWDDMELLFAIQGTGNFFVGDPPRDADGAFKNYSLCMGYSAANWAPPSRQKKGQRSALASKAGPRSLKTQAEVTLRFCELLRHGRLGMTTDDVKLILTTSQWTQTEEGDQIALEKDSTKNKKSGKEGPKKEATPAELILKLALALQGECAEVSFDYFSMHLNCWRMLEGIRKALDSKLRQIFAPDHLENANQMPFVVGYIFIVAAQKEVQPGLDPLDLMQMAVSPMTKIIQDHGHTVRDSLERVGIVNEIEHEDEGDDM